jgi:hypothetical protein
MSGRTREYLFCIEDEHPRTGKHRAAEQDFKFGICCCSAGKLLPTQDPDQAPCSVCVVYTVQMQKLWAALQCNIVLAIIAWVVWRVLSYYRHAGPAPQVDAKNAAAKARIQADCHCGNVGILQVKSASLHQVCIRHVLGSSRPQGRGLQSLQGNGPAELSAA